ncbi:MAG: FAD-dependent oxidoreductase [Clostridia bacterium]|nr:FAD-dependent oxidoreductase [Clostridia bacterium]
MKQYDVIVVGGGFAGVCAAISASENGARTLLVDKSNALGGAAHNCLINPFMPTHTKINGEKKELSLGFFQKIREELLVRNALKGITFSEEELKYVLQKMVQKAGVDILFHAYLHSAKCEAGVIKALEFSTVEGPIVLSAPYYVDATGDAQLAYLAGCPTRLGREKDNLCQPMTLCFRVGGVDVDAFYRDKNRLNELYKQYRAEGKIKNPREDILVFRMTYDGVLHFNTTRVVKKNPTDVFAVTQAELEARDQVFELLEFLKSNTESMKNAYLLSTAAQIGVRESRMIVGEYVLTQNDCLNFTKFDDSIAVSNYEIDIHNPEGSGTSHYFFPDGKYFTIPYRSLIPKNADNLLVAGRCISSDHEAQASYRIMPIVANIGEAAGVAIALASKYKVSPKSIDVKELQSILLSRNAFLG